MQTTSKTNYGLFDFSSRDNNDTLQVVQVPVSGSNEFFLIASRIKKSSYDRIMAGDTAHDNPFRDINSGYGKGVYILHTPSGYDYPPLMDQECADGLFNWTNSGNSIPDWSINQELPYYVKSSVSYRNDSNSHYSGSLLDVDEKSLGTWFGIGKRHTTLNEDGTDRIFTNDNNIWTSRAWKGDRYDAWNIGYNEIFSPYSSPSTNSWDNTNTGIFIWYYNFTGSTPADLAYFKIYKAGVGESISLDSALHLTPPSRPMGLVVIPCDSQPTINGLKNKLRWNHNMERI